MARSFRFKTLVAVVGLVAVGAGAFFGPVLMASVAAVPPVGQATPAERPAQPVRVTRVSFAVARAIRTFTGTVRPQHEAALAFRVPGKIVTRLVEVGDSVATGQILARLDDADARLGLEAAEAEVQAASIDLSRASAQASRSRGLFTSGFAAKAALDDASSARAQAQGRLDRALQSRGLAMNMLSYHVLVADAAGVVTVISAEAGQVVAAGQPVASVARTDTPDVVFALPEQMRNVVAGAQASARLWDDDGRAYALTLRDISPDADPVTRTYRVRMTLQVPDAAVVLGRTMTVTLVQQGAAPVVSLPLAAVMNDGQGAAVWRLNPKSTAVQRVPVEIAALKQGVAEVRGPLAEGDLVVSLGAQKIDPARPVRVVQTATVPAM